MFVLLELVLGPRLALVQAAGLSVPPPQLRVPLLLAIALLLIRFGAGVRFSQLGLRRWREWSTTEKSYLLQVALVFVAVFSWIFAERLRAASWAVCASYLLWGFYQELMYRGILQTELVRRWRAPAAILTSNALYAFGPLHFYHLGVLPPLQAALMLGTIFAIGLFFAVLYHRSGNLWIVGVLHGIGDVYFTGLATNAASA